MPKVMTTCKIEHRVARQCSMNKGKSEVKVEKCGRGGRRSRRERGNILERCRRCSGGVQKVFQKGCGRCSGRGSRSGSPYSYNTMKRKETRVKAETGMGMEREAKRNKGTGIKGVSGLTAEWVGTARPGTN